MADIIVAGNTSGSITLSAPAVSGSSVLTLPVATDTLVGKATTDTLTNKSIVATQLTGTIAAARLPAGSVVQVVNATTTTATSTTSATFVATLLTASITPRSASNKVLVQVTGPIDSAATNSQANGTIYRGATILSSAGGFTNIFSNSGRIIGSLAMTHLDSPSTTSSTTYTVYINCSNGSTIVFPQGTNTASIILMEIQG
jgi:hypothetical protein